MFSVYLAQHGFEVRAIDFIKKALDLARERARQVGVRIQFVHADVLRWLPTGPFDVVLDSGCLHSLNPADRPTYRQHLLKWLEPDGDYILVHFEKRHPLDWRPIGPRRYSQSTPLAGEPDAGRWDQFPPMHQRLFAQDSEKSCGSLCGEP